MIDLLFVIRIKDDRIEESDINVPSTISRINWYIYLVWCNMNIQFIPWNIFYPSIQCNNDYDIFNHSKNYIKNNFSEENVIKNTYPDKIE